MNRFHVVKVKKGESSKSFIIALALSSDGIVLAEPIVNCEDSWKLAKKLGAASPQQMARHFFDSEENDPLKALEFLILDIKCGGTYIPPTSMEILNLVATSFSKMLLPDLSKIDKNSIFDTFKNMWGRDTIDSSKLEILCKLVKEKSKGKVELSLLDSKIFLVQKPHAAYLMLTLRGGLRKQKLLMRPDIPIEFVD